MKNISKLTCIILALGVATALPLALHAQTIVFHDSFENDGTGYNVPNTGTDPAYSQSHTGVVNTTPGDSSYNVPNGGPDYITDAPTSMSTGYVAGQDGNRYVTLTNGGGAGDNDGPPFADRTPSAQTDTLTTLNGSRASGQPGTFVLGTYTLSVRMASSANPDVSGTFALLDGTTGTTLDSQTVQFGMTGSPADSNFHTYSFTFDTTTDPSIVGDAIQIALTTSTTPFPFGSSVSFDDLTLTIPEPSTWALMLAGSALVVGLSVRRFSRRA